MSRRAGVTLAAAATLFALVTTGVGMASGAPADFLVADLTSGGTFIVAGLAAVWLRPGSPAGPLLLLSGVFWFAGSYAPTEQPVVMWLGFAFEAYYDLALAALLLMLSSPAGRLGPRWLVAALGIAMGARSAGRLLLQSPEIIPDCGDCLPPNPFAIWPNLDAFIAAEAVSNAAIGVLIAGIGFVALRRLVRAGPVLRRARAPILLAGGVAMLGAAFDKFEYAWSTATGELILELPEAWAPLFSWLLFGARTLVPIGFLLATLRLRGQPGPIGSFAAGLEGVRAGSSLGDAVRTALGDPSLELLRPQRDDDVWLSEDGRPVVLREGDAGRAITRVGPAEAPLAILVHDPALLDQPELMAAVIRVLRLALENERLESELREQLAEVTASRERIVTATEEERRRIERDLHDGAQQRLVGITLALQQARETAESTPAPAALREQLDFAAQQTTEAIRELRELARGIHPAILEDDGLGPAVAAIARRAGIPVDVRLELDGRPSRLVESTAYFTIAEALINAQRHAGASHALVRVAASDGFLVVEIRDDGHGGADPSRGTGLGGLADRVGALGGRFEVKSDPGQGTVVRATIPSR